jgi:serine/threonine-protein kinase RsbW
VEAPERPATPERWGEHAPFGYLRTDADGVILDANQTLLTWIGLDRAQVVGQQRFIDLLTVGGRLLFETHYLPLLLMRDTVNGLAVDLTRAGDRPLPVLLTSTLHRDARRAPETIETFVFEATDRREYERELLRARRAAERSEQALRSLDRLEADLVGAVTVSDAADALILAGCASLQAGVAVVWFLDPDRHALRAASRSRGPWSAGLERIAPSELPLWSVVEQGKRMVIESAEQAQARWPALASWMRSSAQEHFLVVPLGDPRHVTGVVAFAGLEPFPQAGLELIDAGAGVAGQALERGHLLEAERRLRAWGDLLTGVATRVGATYDMQEIASSITDEVTRSGLVDRVWFVMADETNTPKAFTLDPLGGGPLTAREAVVTAGTSLALPLVSDGHYLGTLYLSFAGDQRFPAPDPALVGALATQCAQAFERARMHVELEALSMTDPLTGLANRRTLGRDLERALGRLARTNASLAVMLLDLDAFKAVNDRYGHRVGDDLLLRVAGQLQSVVRAPAAVARLGGDEFVVLVEDLKRVGDASSLALRIAQSIDLLVGIAGEPETRVTASIGVAIAAGPGVDADQLLLEADKAMYQAKHTMGAGPRIKVVESRSAQPVTRIAN